MKSPTNDFNAVIYVMLAVWIASLVVAFAAGMWVQARFGS